MIGWKIRQDHDKLDHDNAKVGHNPGKVGHHHREVGQVHSKLGSTSNGLQNGFHLTENNLGSGGKPATPSIDKTYNQERISMVEPSIPKIIHQTWDNENVPRVFAKWARSWQERHPDWEYWFWRPNDVLELLKLKFPDYIPIYNGLKSMGMKTDFFRYFVMSVFGGLYVDIDVESLKPLDAWIKEKHCILSAAPLEHIIFLPRSSHIQTTVMACWPGHPFYRMAIKMLPDSAATYPDNLKQIAGPGFLNRVYKNYSNTNHSSRHVMIEIIDSNVFLPSFSDLVNAKLKSACWSKKTRRRLDKSVKDLCEKHRKSPSRNGFYRKSYANHHWAHVVTWRTHKKQSDNVDIFHFIPTARKPTDIIKKLK